MSSAVLPSMKMPSLSSNVFDGGANPVKPAKSGAKITKKPKAPKSAGTTTTTTKKPSAKIAGGKKSIKKAGTKVAPVKSKKPSVKSAKPTKSAMKSKTGGVKRKRKVTIKKVTKHANPLRDPEIRSVKRVKRQSSAWVFFSKLKRPTLSESLRKNFGQGTKELAKMWSQMSAAERKPFVAKEKKDRIRYKSEFNNRSVLQVKKDKLIKRVRKKNRRQSKRTLEEAGHPKRPWSAYMFFAQTNRPKILAANPSLKFADVGRELGAAWKKLSGNERKEYEAYHTKNKEMYEIKKAAFEKAHPELIKK